MITTSRQQSQNINIFILFYVKFLYIFVIVLKHIYTSVITSLIIFSCTLEEGDGGKGSITGKVIAQEIYNNPIVGIVDSVAKEYPAIGERVYLTYGDNSIYDEDFRTDENGNYKFENLTKGNYTLTFYSYCDSCDTEITSIYTDVTLESHKDNKDIGTTYIEVD